MWNNRKRNFLLFHITGRRLNWFYMTCCCAFAHTWLTLNVGLLTIVEKLVLALWGTMSVLGHSVWPSGAQWQCWGSVCMALWGTVSVYYFRGGGLTWYIQILQGAKMSLFSNSLAFLCKEHLCFFLSGGAIGGTNLNIWEDGGYSPPSLHLEPQLQCDIEWWGTMWIILL